MESIDEFKAMVGAWSDAGGTILSAIAETRVYHGLEEWNNYMIAIGEALQAFGEILVGTSGHDGPLFYLGSWINEAGAATSSIAAYLTAVEGDQDAYIHIQILGEALQSMGSAFQSYGDYLLGNYIFSAGNALQSLGAGLESIAGLYDLQGKDEARLLAMIGSWIQASGSNLFAVEMTKNIIFKEKSS